MTATKMAAPCTTVRCGAGVVNAASAVRYAAGRLLAGLGTPTITGTPAPGSTLTVQLAGVPSAATISYQWLRSGVAISGATAPTYILTSTDVGKPISARVTAAIGVIAVDRVAGTITAVPPAPSNFKAVKAPSTSGTFTVGQTVKTSAGIQSPAPTTTAYQWLRNGASISGATKSSYKLATGDVGKLVAAKVTVSRSGYTTAFYLAASHTVSATFVATKGTSATGTFKVGRTVKVSRGTQVPTPTTATYRWLRNGVTIGGATKTSYKLTKTDKGKLITATVTVSRSGYATASFTSGKHKVS